MGTFSGLLGGASTGQIAQSTPQELVALLDELTRLDQTEQTRCGIDFGVCHGTANWIRRRLGRGQMYGYRLDDNPAAKVGAAYGGHDFLVVDDRWLVDWWGVHWSGDTDWLVLDLTQQMRLAERLYGPRTRWKAAR